MKLYSVVLFAVLVAVVSAGHGKGKGKGPMGQLFKKCKEEIKASDEDMKSLKSNEPTANAKCVVDCISKQLKVVKPDGSFDAAEATKMIEKVPEKKREHMKKAVDECKSEAKAGLGKCESGFKLGKCVMGKMFQHRKGNDQKKPKHSSEED